MSSRSAPDQPESPDLSSADSTSSTNSTDETVIKDHRRCSEAGERFHRRIDAYTTALNTIESNLLTINQQKTALAITNIVTKFKTTNPSETEIFQAQKLRRKYWRERQRVYDREKHLQNQLVVLTRWVKKLKRDVEGFVREEGEVGKDEDEDMSDAA